jgi:hypothetical protein
MLNLDQKMSAGLIALAVVARAAAVLGLQSHTVPRSTYEHGEIAANLLNGRGFSVRFLGAEGPTSQQAPVYPLLVTAAYALGGIGTPRALLILELGQAALGGVLVAVVLALARAVVPERRAVGWLAGLVVAAHPTLVYAATHVQVASVAATALAATFLMAYRTAVSDRSRTAMALGLLLGLTTLTDPILGLAGPGVAWAIVAGRGRRGLRLVAVAGSMALLTVSPWIARNYRVHGELVWIKSTFGYAFWQGNCAQSEGTDKVARTSVERQLATPSSQDWRGWNAALWAARHEAGYLDDIVLTAEDYRVLSRLSEPERSRLLFHRALDDLRAEPSRYPQLCLRRLRYFVFWDETNPKTRSKIYRLGHLTLTALALVGWLRMGTTRRRRWMPTALTAIVIALFHALTIVSARFHVPLEPLMALWASSGLAASRTLSPFPIASPPTPSENAISRRPGARRAGSPVC